MTPSPIITPARRGYSLKNRKRYTRQRRTIAILAILAAIVAAGAYFLA